ncbi:uncharacterized protein LOC135944454 isoform X1 [Cloeon dipterum]|uniref:uncharacterized protein LOC135944454 isoform X1 n=1 Tax=Cloeon dipterum TaxID=197152 RepID=UPI00321FC023
MELDEPLIESPTPPDQDNDIEELDPLAMATPSLIDEQKSEKSAEEVHHESKKTPQHLSESVETPKVSLVSSSPSLLFLALKAAPLEAAFLTDDENDEEFGGFEVSEKQTPAEAKELKLLESELEEAEAAAALEVVSESEESLPGSPGDLVIADSSEEPLSPQEMGGKRKRAPSIASTASGGSSASRGSRKFDPTLPLYQKPFQRGFVREVVYRSTFDISKESNHADIYYFLAPNGKKLRSSVDVARYLSDNAIPLPLESFTFAREPLGIADSKKEIIRYAKTKESPPPPKIKRPAAPPPAPKTPVVQNVNGGGIRPPKRARKSTYQDPVWITSDPKNKQTPCGIYCAKAAGEVPTLQCSSCVCLYHPICVGLNQLDSSLLLGYICNNCRQEKSSQKSTKFNAQIKKEPKPEAPPQSLVVLEGRQFVVIPKTGGKAPLAPPPPPPAPTPAPPQPNENHEASSAMPESAKDTSAVNKVANKPREKKIQLYGPDFVNNLNTGTKMMLQVFSYLTVKELLRASRVCSSWRLISENRSLWRIVRLKNSSVTSWNDCTEWLNHHRTELVDLRKMVMPERNPVAVWSEVAAALSQVRSLKAVELGRCAPAAVALTAGSCSKLTALSASSLTSSDDTLDMNCLRGMTQLEKLRLRGAYSLNVRNLSSLQKLPNLTCLSVTSVKGLPGMDVAMVLNDLPGLEVLELGECFEMVHHAEILTEVLAKLQFLRRLRLEYLSTQRPHTDAETLVTFFESLTALPRLEHLELVHIEAPPGCDLQISKLSALRSLLLVPSFVHQGAVTSQVLLRGVLQLKNLTKLTIGLTTPISETGHKAFTQKLARSSPQSAPAPKPHEDCLPVATPLPTPKSALDPFKPFSKKLDSIEVVPGWHLQKVLKESLPNAVVNVRLLSHPNRYTLDEWLLL